MTQRYQNKPNKIFYLIKDLNYFLRLVMKEKIYFLPLQCKLKLKSFKKS